MQLMVSEFCEVVEFCISVQSALFISKFYIKGLGIIAVFFNFHTNEFSMTWIFDDVCNGIPK